MEVSPRRESVGVGREGVKMGDVPMVRPHLPGTELSSCSIHILGAEEGSEEPSRTPAGGEGRDPLSPS